VVGDVMNTAARLMAAAAAAGKPVYCDAAIARAAADAASDEGAASPPWFLDGGISLGLKGHAGTATVFAPPPADDSSSRKSSGELLRAGCCSTPRRMSVDTPRRTSSDFARRTSFDVLRRTSSGRAGGCADSMPRRCSSNDLQLAIPAAIHSMQRASSFEHFGRSSSSSTEIIGAEACSSAAAAAAGPPPGAAPPLLNTAAPTPLSNVGPRTPSASAGAGDGAASDSSDLFDDEGDDLFCEDSPECGGSGNVERPAALFGRDADVARVLSLLRDADARRGLLVVISGGMSIGKTSFLRACAAAARDEGLCLFPLALPDGGVAAETPYNSWRTAWLADAIADELQSLPASLRPLAPLLADLLPPNSSGLTAALALPGSAAAIAALPETALPSMRAALVCAVLRPTLGSGNGVLLQDDMSESDSLSCELLAAVLASLKPTALVTAGRGELDDPDSAAAAAVALVAAKATSYRTCGLGPLAAAAVEALCAAELSITPAGLPTGLVQGLTALTGGHPLFVKELISLLLWQGHITLEDGGALVNARCDVSRLDELAALGPSGSDGMARLEVLVQRRVDSLGPAARGALKAAAVLGHEFDLPLLARACAGHVTLAAARSLAAELVDEGMWVHVHTPRAAIAGGGVKYRFAHEVVRALVYASMPSDQRVELHSRVLRWLEEAQELRAVDTSRGGVGAPEAVPAMQWAERARHARGANLHAKATSYFLASARASATGVAAARRVSEATRLVQEGLASLRAAEQGAAEQAAEQASGSLGTRTPRCSTTSLCSSPGSASFIESCSLDSRSCTPPDCALPTAVARRPRSSQSGMPSQLDMLRCELMAVLDAVRRVQASWAQLEPQVEALGVALMREFFRRCDEAKPLFAFGNMSYDDPAAEPAMRKHAIMLMSTVGSCIAGLRDFEAMIPTLVSVGKMHAKFGTRMREFFPPMGAALIATLRSALGEEFTPEVEAAWVDMYGVVTMHIYEGIGKAERAAAEENTLRSQLMGGS
jgi:hemoglobin-like flavoprotein